MYAVFQISGFQFNGEEGTVLQVPHQSSTPGDTLEITDVLLVKNNDTTLVGTPIVEGAKIEAEVLREGLGEKVIVYKQKRRTKYRRKQGHRQGFSEIRIKKITVPLA